MKPSHSTANVFMLMDAIPGREGNDVIDPYYGTAEGFETTWHDVEAGCKALATRVLDPLAPSTEG